MQNTSHKLTPLAALVALFVAGCGGGSSDVGVAGTSGDFLVLRSDPPNNANLFLNEPINVDFTNLIDIKSANFDAVSFAVFDLNMNPLTEPVSGTFHMARSPGDNSAGRRLQFRPTFPKSDTYDDGGFKPGRIYFVQMVEGNHHTGVGLRDMGNKGLKVPFTFAFTTADGTTPSQLFRDTKVGGPRRTGVTITPRDPQTFQVALNELGQQQVEIRLQFDQPLNPNSANVPFKVDLDPVVRDQSKRGRIFLEYDSRLSKDLWIPAEVDLERNELDGATVVLRPIGILPNNATIRVIVESTLEDMSGESNVNDAAYDRVFDTFETDSSYELRFDAVVEDFTDASQLDLEAPFLEPLAEMLPGAIKANFDFEGKDTNLRYEPNTPEVILNTDFTQITPKGAPKINVSGGVFEFRSVTIPEGVTVKATGSKPMVWLVLEDFTVKGRLLSDGGEGMRVDTINSANFPTAGGIGGAGGGNGGDASTNTKGRSLTGGTGFGPGQVPGGGGQGGQIFCSGSCGRGSGGGGGSMATKGDPWYKAKASGTRAFVQQKGQGGYGCNGSSGATSRTLPGGLPGPIIFKDPQVDNNFWGSAVNVWLQKRVTGELENPLGGAGGGGGGDYSLSGCNVSDPNFANDDKGGGGGGGGGIIIIKALGSIKIDTNGLISVNGGNGGGGAWAGANSRGGGGGSGSGGMIVLMAGVSIDIVIHGQIGSTSARTATYAGNNFDFCLSADGGAGLTALFTGGIVSKYVPFPSASSRDSTPSGALGGQGVIQLMAPPGTPGTTNVDGTNTVLDDNIHFHVGSLNSAKVEGTRKMELLAWRGMPDANGQMRDDDGKAISIGDDEGDMRPTPHLAPAPFGSRSRARRKWVDLGASVRRIVASSTGDSLPGGVYDPGAGKIGEDFGPQPFFAGTDVGVPTDPRYGFVRYENDGQGGVRIVHTPVVTGEVDSAQSTAVHKGQNVYEVRLKTSVLGSQIDRYSHYTAQLLTNGAVRGEFRILGHNDNTLYLFRDNALAADDSLPTDITDVKVLDKFFYVFTGAVEGFPQTYSSSKDNLAPRGNVQIGFAFHKDPGKPDLSTPGEDQNRFPKRLGTFVYNLNSASAVEAIRAQHLRYMRWDILFD
ncbi:MAG: hypothetical protein ACYTKC_00820, partial [Planctomycetota bacterium]